MKKLNLQLFSEAVSGKKVIYLYRVLKEASTTAAQGLAFTSENGRIILVVGRWESWREWERWSKRYRC